MDYRDDRDALRGRVEDLEQDLERAKKELDDRRTEGGPERRAAKLEGELAAMRRQLASMETELGELRPRATHLPAVSGRSGWLVGGAFVGVFVLFVLAAGVLTLRSSTAGSSSPVSRATIAPPPPPMRSNERRIDLSWSAKVTLATGLPYDAKSSCTTHAVVTSDGVALSDVTVDVACDGQTLYRSTDALEGTSMAVHNVDEEAGEGTDGYSYSLTYQDQGPRTGARTQISIATLAHNAVVWKDTAPAFRVELEMPELSKSRTGDPLFESSRGRPQTFAALELPGVVKTMTGAGPVATKQACVTRVRSAWRSDGENCRVVVTCGKTIVYGAGTGGFATCTQIDGQVVSAKDVLTSDKDQDPALDVELLSRTVSISDVAASGAWSATIALGPGT